jgi:hypothetical protein
MDRERINVIAILLDNTFDYAIFDAQDYCQLCPPIQFSVANIRVVDFFKRPKVNN